jgi:Concanavalin A-like lectin/glucanases superfamily
VGVYAGPEITNSGLVLALDAGNTQSYNAGISSTTWTDLSSNGNTGTLTNMDGTNFNSANGGLLTFDGTNEYVTCGDPSSLNFGTGNFTISFIVYTTVYGFQGGSYVGKGNGTTIGFDFRDGAFFVYGTTGLIAQGAFAATLNVWEHHTITYDSSSSPYVKFYKNGSYTGGSTTNNSANISSITTTEPFRIGLSVAGGPTRYFNGRMPLVQAYNRALTASEIQQNFNATRGRFGI